MNRFAIDLKRLANDRTSGRLAGEVNRALPGASSVIQSTARRLRNVDDADLAQNGAAALLQANKRWGMLVFGIAFSAPAKRTVSINT